MALGIASYFRVGEWVGAELALQARVWALEALRVWPYYQHQPRILGCAGEGIGAAPGF